jgi:hypothetical protein
LAQLGQLQGRPDMAAEAMHTADAMSREDFCHSQVANLGAMRPRKNAARAWES